MKPAVLHAEAEAELDGAVARYERIKPGLGQDLLQEFEAALLRIRDNPQL